MEYEYPILLLDETRCRNNIHQMAEKAKRNGVLFRPHAKTHQSVAVGEWFRQAGITSITVSSLKMARYFAMSGWKDIFLAFPVNILETPGLNKLAGETDLTLSIESVEVAAYLIENLDNPVRFMIKIDTGYHRTGLLPGDKQITSILELVDNTHKHSVTGLYTHTGQTYQAKSVEEVREFFEETVSILTKLRDEHSPASKKLVLSIGDTPSCSLVDDYLGMDEIRPGNFVFYDLMQAGIGACGFNDISIVLLCPVVAKHPSRLEVVIHGGAVHLSKEQMEYKGVSCYGLVVPYNGQSWDEAVDGVYVHRLSQEHGIIRATPGFFDEIKIGDLVGILPVHSCLTANLAERYVTTQGQLFSKIRS